MPKETVAGQGAPGVAPAAVSGRQAFQERVAADFAEALNGRALSVVIAGIDRFRVVNDYLGPEQGDAVLDRLGEEMHLLADRVWRLGGDEFAVSLPGVAAQEAVSMAEQVRERVARTVRTPVGAMQVSLGVSNYPDGAASAEEMVYGAHAAMYWAKATGGNKVGYWTELISPDGAVWKRRGTVSDPVSALVAALERKTMAQPGQNSRSAWYAKRVAKALGLPVGEQEIIEVAGLLHDVGKLAIPNEILLKPGALTEEEKAIARQHPLVGRDILSRIPSLAPAAPIVAHHHEHYDGSGYPDGLRGEAIPLGSRIILVSDAFDAMTTHRVYRSAISLQMAVRELEHCSGQQFDPRVVEAFVQIVTQQGLNALHWSQLGGR